MYLLKKEIFVSVSFLPIFISSTTASEKLEEDFNAYRDRGLYRFCEERRRELYPEVTREEARNLEERRKNEVVSEKLRLAEEQAKIETLKISAESIINKRIDYYMMLIKERLTYGELVNFCKEIRALYQADNVIIAENQEIQKLCTSIIDSTDNSLQRRLISSNAPSDLILGTKNIKNHIKQLNAKLKKDIVGSMDMYKRSYKHSQPSWEKFTKTL